MKLYADGTLECDGSKALADAIALEQLNGKPRIIGVQVSDSSGQIARWFFRLTIEEEDLQ